jgi:dihydrofolate reductase
MGDVIVIQFVTLDGVVSDPDGRWGTDHGGWAFRHGRGPVDGDTFRLGERMERGVQLYGRRTWEHFARLWPTRTGGYSDVMNAVPKRVATRGALDVAAWPNSAVIDGDPVAWVEAERTARDVVVIGSLSLVRTLAARDVVDEYRLLTIPTVLGVGDRLFGTGAPADYRHVNAELVDSATLTILRRDRDPAASRRAD